MPWHRRPRDQFVPLAARHGGAFHEKFLTVLRDLILVHTLVCIENLPTIRYTGGSKKISAFTVHFEPLLNHHSFSPLFPPSSLWRRAACPVCDRQPQQENVLFVVALLDDDITIKASWDSVISIQYAQRCRCLCAPSWARLRQSPGLPASFPTVMPGILRLPIQSFLKVPHRLCISLRLL